MSWEEIWLNLMVKYLYDQSFSVNVLLRLKCLELNLKRNKNSNFKWTEANKSKVQFKFYVKVNIKNQIRKVHIKKNKINMPVCIKLYNRLLGIFNFTYDVRERNMNISKVFFLSVHSNQGIKATRMQL